MIERKSLTPEIAQSLVDVNNEGILVWKRGEVPSNVFWDIANPLPLMALISQRPERQMFDDIEDCKIEPHGRIMVAPEGEGLGNSNLYREFLRSKTYDAIKDSFHPKTALLVGALSEDSLQQLLHSFKRLGWTDVDIDIVDPSPAGLAIIDVMRDITWSWEGIVRTIQLDVRDHKGKYYDVISADIVSAYAIPKYDQQQTDDPFGIYREILESVNEQLNPNGVFVSRVRSYPTSNVWAKEEKSGYFRQNISVTSKSKKAVNLQKLTMLLGKDIINKLDQQDIDNCLTYGFFPDDLPNPMCGLEYMYPHKYAKLTTSFEQRGPQIFRSMYKDIFFTSDTAPEELMVWDQKRKWLLQTFIIQKAHS